MRQNPAYGASLSVHSMIEENGRVVEPYALLETSHKTYEIAGLETSQYDKATMMTGFDSHPYDEVAEMSGRRDTGSFA